MIDLFEKICAGFCGLVVIAVGASYVVFGLPSGKPGEFLPEAQSRELPSRKPPDRPNEPGEKPVAEGPDYWREDDQEIKEQLRKQGVRVANAPVRRLAQTIPNALFEEIDNERNWTKELKKARSMILRSSQGQSRLKIEGMTANCKLRKLGLEDGDVVELVNGQILQFNDSSAMEYRRLAKDAIGELRQGGSVSVTVTRGGQPVHLIFSLNR